MALSNQSLPQLYPTFMCLCVASFLLPTFARGADNFRITTYNVNRGNRNVTGIVDAMVDARPDLICLRETTPELERFLRTRLRGLRASIRLAKMTTQILIPPGHGQHVHCLLH